MLVNFIKGSPMNDFLYFIPYLIILIIGFFLAEEKPAKTMMLFGTMAMTLMILGLFLNRSVAIYCFISGGLFCSVMWPCIFSLSIAGLGKYTNQGSALLIMMIFGGAIIPPLQGYLSDLIGIHLSYIIPALCFAYLAYYGYAVKKVLANQGIDYENTNSAQH
jgi:FHS family L-fucose permease-like MFS transporter